MQQVSVTNDSWHTLTTSPTAKGSCVVELESTDVSALFVATKSYAGNNVSKISSVASVSVYFECQWTASSIQIRAVNNSSSFDITVNIK